MNKPAQIVRKGRKFDQVLAGARTIFMRDGFEGASVDDIAREAGVSKATLYSYFPDKRLLFLEVANAECQRQAKAVIDLVDLNATPRQVLTTAGRFFLRFITSRFGQQIFRIFVAESGRFPEIGQAFYMTGPNVTREEMVRFMSFAVDRGDLVIEDLYLAADQFAEMCKAGVWMQLIFGMIDDVSDEEIAYIVGEAVETFMARYGA